ncbi:MAG TPA: proton-conducting transporter membrane subunit, partial [Bacteroidota bacterium]|nr:proton-conducting transporter membrane subunit [Bacteroidota bacterium]
TVAIPAVIVAYSYLDHYLAKREAAVRAFLVTFSVLLLSTQLLMLAAQAIVFLVFWEVMTLCAYLGLLLEKEKEEVQRGSLIYFATTHMATFILYIFFFLLHNSSGSWFFTDFHITVQAGAVFYAVCGLGFIGFAIKAGFMPFHFWLPWAHPIAPTVLSAFLSGVIIKTGIYGILRVIEFCSPMPAWIGIVIMAISMFSALFGVWYALAQHDIKKLLAYHSIENIGIIGIGIGIGVIGIAYSVQSLIWLGFGGALFHTFNHAIFKTLLFLGSGIIYHNFGTRSIEDMGGIVHRAPWFVALFLIGTLAISGIPPLNGFMSEFLIYKGFFETASALGMYFPLFMLVMAVGLAFVGGLALGCFTKIDSVMFLGTERTPLREFPVTGAEYASLGAMALLCIVFGIYPQSVLGVITSVITYNRWGIPLQPYSMFAQWNVMTLVFVGVLVAAGAILAVKMIGRKQRIAPAWGCGFSGQTSKMQYTASSYADEINSIAATMLQIHSHVTPPDSIFPKPSHFESHAGDFSEDSFVLPLYRALLNKVNSFEFLSRTDIRFYILFMLIVVLVYGGVAIVWTYF